jgi:hypothetical protein
MEFKIKGKKITDEERDYLSRLGLKWCSRCKQSLEFNNFGLSSKLKDGYGAICKECYKNKRKNNLEYYKQLDYDRYYKNREKLLKKHASYVEKNREQINEQKRKHYQENKERLLKISKEYRLNNLEKIKKKQKERYLKNKDYISIVNKEYRKKNAEKLKEYVNNRYRNDEKFRLRKVCRQLVRRMFISINTNKNQTTREILGYTPDELKQHIEKQFKPGMNWDNYGEWHIDHIIPISTAKNLEEGIELSKLENLQPLWAEENLTKGNKTNWEKIN